MDDIRKVKINEELSKSEDENDFYDWMLVPKCYSEENKTGVSFTGGSTEYLNAHEMICKLLNKKGAKLSVNDRVIRVLDNAKNKAIKVEVKPLKGSTGKVNLKIYGLNNRGSATMIVSKTKESELLHVKTLAFKIIKYLLDGIIDGEIKASDLESFKVEENGIHKEESLTCNICEKTFKTKNGMSIHRARMHKESKQKNCVEVDNESLVHDHGLEWKVKCDLCSFVFKDTEAMALHVKSDHVIASEVKNVHDNDEADSLKNKEVSFICDFCDIKILAENNLDGLLNLKKHHEVCICKPKPMEVDGELKCSECEYETVHECKLKRHIRDKHDITTASTSPKPKKRRNITVVEAEKMEIDDYEDVLLARSKMWDERVMKKAQEVQKEEEKNKKKMENKKKQEEKEKVLKRNEEERRRKLRLKVKMKEKKKNLEELKLKPFLKEVPKYVRNIIGDDYFVYMIRGDGSCGLRTTTTWVHQDQSLGPYLARNVNRYFVENWEYWQHFFSYPFERDIGNGGKISKENPEELLEFFQNSNEGAYMWRGQEDFIAVCSIYQINIKMITITGEDDENPVVNIFEPNPELSDASEFSVGQVPDMTVLHLKDSHYDLIVPRNSKLAIEGGLDYQREVEMKRNKQEKMDHALDPQKSMGLEEKISKLEAGMRSLQEKVSKLEKENEELRAKNKAQSKASFNVDVDDLSNEKDIPVNETGQSGFWEVDLERMAHVCIKCEKEFETEHKLEEHVQEHIIEVEVLNVSKESGFRRISPQSKPEAQKNLEKIKCEKCDKSFQVKSLLNVHMKNCHEIENEDQLKQFNCDDCPFQGENRIELKKHIQRTKHCPSECIETCYTCKKEFLSYWHLMNHRKTEHPSKKICRYFRMQACDFDAETCWYRHENNSSEKEEIVDEDSCKDCDEKFQIKSDLMKHRKMNHRSKVYGCRDFVQGKCTFQESSCWFLHDKVEEDNESLKDIERKKQDFHEAQKNIPPDQMTLMMNLIQKLSLQVEMLEKNSIRNM